MVRGLKMLMEPINQFGLLASVKRVIHKTSIFEKLAALLHHDLQESSELN